MTEREDHDVLDDRPPFLGSWRNIYVLMVTVLAVLIAIFTVVTRWAS